MLWSGFESGHRQIHGSFPAGRVKVEGQNMFVVVYMTDEYIYMMEILGRNIELEG